LIDTNVVWCVVCKASENATDDLEYWLSPESAAAEPTSTTEAALPSNTDTTQQHVGPESLDDTERPASVG